MAESFKKTVITVTVLSTGDWDWDSLGDVAYAITEGDCSGQVETQSVSFLSREEMAEALEAQGSSPSFLLGEDEDEEDEEDGQA